MRWTLALLCGAALGSAEFAITPEHVVIDARQATPAPATIRIRSVDAQPLKITANLVDQLAAFAPAGTDLGTPVFPIALSMAKDPLGPGQEAQITVEYRPEQKAIAARAWQIQTHVIRITSDKPGATACDVPAMVRYHAQPILKPALPVASITETATEFAFTLRSGDPDERIARVELRSVRGKAGPIAGCALSSDKPESYRVSAGRIADGLVMIELSITYDLPAPTQKLLQVRGRVGTPAAAPAGPADGPPAGESPPQRRIRIN